MKIAVDTRTGRGRAGSRWARPTPTPRPWSVAGSAGATTGPAAPTAASGGGPSAGPPPRSSPPCATTRPARRPAPGSPTHPAAILHRERSTAGTPFRRCGRRGTAAAAAPSGRGGRGPTAPIARGCLARLGGVHTGHMDATWRGSPSNTWRKRRQRPQNRLGWSRWGHRLTSARTQGSRCLFLRSFGIRLPRANHGGGGPGNSIRRFRGRLRSCARSGRGQRA